MSVDVGHPVAHRFVDRVLQRAAARIHLAHGRAEQPHAQHVGRLPRHVFGAHVDVALEAEQRAGRRRRDAVLSRARLGDDAALAHAAGQQRLPEGVVDLVRAGVRQVLALEEDARAAGLRGQPPRLVERRGPSDVVLQQRVELLEERRGPRGRGSTRASVRRPAPSASRGRTGRRTGRSSPARPDRAARTPRRSAVSACLVVTYASTSRTARNQRAHSRLVLHAGRPLDARRHVDAGRADAHHDLGDVVGPQAAGQDDGPRRAPARRRAPSPPPGRCRRAARDRARRAARVRRPTASGRGNGPSRRHAPRP